MPEVSITISAQDRYSAAIKSMSQITKSFSKDAEAMEGILGKLNKNRYSLKLDLKDAEKQLERAEKQFKKTDKASDLLKRDAALAKYDAIQRNLALVTKGAREAEQQMQRTGTAFRKADNQAGGFGLNSIVKAIDTSGLQKMINGVALEAASTMAGSAFGDEAGNMVSSTLSMAISGAAMGSMIPIPGARLIGAAIGGGLGLVSGAIQNFQKQDDAFKGYVQDQYTGVKERRSAELTGGSAIAAGRENDLLPFATLFGDRSMAEGFLGELASMANTTPLQYGDLTAMSKTLAGAGYEADSLLPVLQTLGDTGAALGMSGEGMAALAQALGHVRSGEKVDEASLKALDDQGVDATGILANAFGGADALHKKLSQGELSGADAADAILEALSKSGAEGGYAGALAERGGTFAGRSAQREGWEQELQSAEGEAYNTARGEGMERQNEYYEGIADSMSEMNGIIGESKAYLENLNEQYGREAMSALLTGAETSLYGTEQAETLTQMHEDYTSLVEQYESAGEEDKAVLGAKIEALKGEAESMAESAYNASTGMQSVKDVQVELISAIRENTDAIGTGAWKNAYDLSQEASKGLWAAKKIQTGDIQTETSGGAQARRFNHGMAMGQRVVPYDNFPALLHQGERVLTASEARQADREGGVSVSFTGPVTVREEADLDKLARKLAAEVVRARVLAAP